ncbi:tRNA (N6-threonylcarbamoyladenosine(37)-N6)-methyltransferase TrmO [Synoicihabitans lomoniglobus]|uniref:tRNA (N6-threonylcarbamoyladenosine(37)-N6)-methyltransferase TrmO n=1 Tax=Synoicihabitans lomoniglobus TaxID=2909285 RepID=A0AAE9ZZY1_9BACT|nr:tRNA (N6-threonylcarbamoyladenosine(37)-N6)-methyltransferase TrmO [Opitutaceae bacterium LMO-M01]WED64618.1 tRNA (N6-threonylcarbamoyladenosine(37)-N6)-methyltransferase TrmO [Opitutaceae bacterium LMO-M01]
MHDSLTLRPIGFIRTAQRVKFQAGHQPSALGRESSVLELVPGHGYDLALRDLEGFSRVWLLSWFHRNTTWRPLVLPPRGPKQRRGVFATRSPHRPNPLGLTAATLLSVDHRAGRVVLGPCDLVEGTPIFDLKPYIAAYDAFPEADGGWTAAVDAALLAPPTFTVGISPGAEEQAEWLLAHWGVDFRPRMLALLARDPSPHRTRRIRRRGDGRMEIGCGAWRGYFTVVEKRVEIIALDAAYPRSWLRDMARTDVPDREAQAALLDRWPSPYGTGDETRVVSDADE